MERLHKRSDGFAETPSGDLAVVMLRHSEGREDGTRALTFHPAVGSPPMRVEWEGEVAVFPSDVSGTLVRLGLARNLTQAEVDTYNADLEPEEKPAKRVKAKAEASPEPETPTEEKEPVDG